ncbi:single-strand binding protein [Centipeda periodontii DSM 2778]|uniref:Single-stranded DNA-binding protein n=1 Tax=Centipeda periodontii DSM 2778 TaxID=888060 RepID=F5RPN7_9FIRM|nr:single-stranded DNA-binding protein [Centipeda periodontii]EGK57705.1 single-strand binding protein [Centipeda periodontii DSM 2778]
MNIVALSGRLGADIIEHITQSGTYVIHFPLAVRKSFKRDEKGNYPVNYFQIEVWGALAKTCKEHLSKGQLVSVSGRLDAKSYDDKNGQKRYTTMVVASAVDFLTPKQATMVDANALNSMAADPEELIQEEMGDESLFRQVMSSDDDDIPF